MSEMSDVVVGGTEDRPELPECVFSIHGIRTNASWQSKLSEQIKGATNFETSSRNYLRFDLFMFVFKGLFSGTPMRLVASDLKDLTKRYRVNVIAHSFGTWLLLEILKDDPDIKVNNVILCGSIFPRGLAWWRKLKTQSNQITGRVVNYCGRRDPFPALAELLSRDYGASGVVGAGEPTVHDSFHDLSHSGFLTERFCEDYWIPFLKDGVIKRSEADSKPLAYIEAILWIAAHRGALLLAAIVAAVGLYHFYQTPLACAVRSCFVDVTRVQDYSKSTEQLYISQITLRYNFNFQLDSFDFNSNRTAQVVSYLGTSLAPITGINTGEVKPTAGSPGEAPTRYRVPVIDNQAFFSSVLTNLCPRPTTRVGVATSYTVRDLTVVLRLPDGAKILRPEGDFPETLVVMKDKAKLEPETKRARQICEVSTTGTEITCPGLYLRPGEELHMPLTIEGWKADAGAIKQHCPEEP